MKLNRQYHLLYKVGDKTKQYVLDSQELNEGINTVLSIADYVEVTMLPIKNKGKPLC